MCRTYFKMRQILYGKTDWVDVAWTHGVLKHTIQKDSYSCGVYVMQVAIQYRTLEHSFLHNLKCVIFKFLILLWLMYFASLFNDIYVTQQMAKEVVESFPETPSKIRIPSSQHILSELRKEIAVTILEASGMYFKHTLMRIMHKSFGTCALSLHIRYGHENPSLLQTDLKSVNHLQNIVNSYFIYFIMYIVNILR